MLLRGVMSKSWLAMTRSLAWRRTRLACMATLGAAAASCQWSENRYLARPVDRAEVIGSWVGTPFGMESLAYAGYKEHLDAADHRLVLRPDGTCEAETVLEPDGPTSSGRGTWVTASTPCRWKIDREGSHERLDMDLAMPSEGERRMLSYYFDEEAEALMLWQYAGDPDAWKYMEFTKVGTPRQAPSESSR